MLLSAGDSFVFGSELDDEYRGQFSYNTFPALLAKHLKLDYACLALPGISNSTISRNVISFLQNKKVDLVVVCWTFPNRQEFFIKDKFVTLNGWNHNVNNDLEKEVVDFSKKYFALACSEYYEKYIFLKEVLLLQNFLKVKDQKYIFTANSKIDFKNLEYADSIDWSQWVWFEGEGFYDWCKRKKFPTGPEGHPLEQAHKEAFELIASLAQW